MKKSNCQPYTVYHSSTVDIQYCPDCRTVHLNLGDISIKMEQQLFTQFSQDMSNAGFEFRAQMEGRQSMLKLM